MPRTAEQNKVYMREYYRKNRDKYAAETVAWRKNNPEKYKAMRERAQAKNPEYFTTIIL